MIQIWKPKHSATVVRLDSAFAHGDGLPCRSIGTTANRLGDATMRRVWTGGSANAWLRQLSFQQWIEEVGMTRLRRAFSRTAAALFGFVLLVLLIGFTYEQIRRAREAGRLPPRIGKAVDVGGHSLNLYCSGEGSPTVVLEAGGNEPGYAWSSVQTKLANVTRACWYDRAGVGCSDPPPPPRTSATVTSDLHE